MTQLNFKALQLPPANLQITQIGDELKVWDLVRKRQITLEPEEWVRQHLVHYFVNHLNFPLSRIMVEAPVKVNNLNQRADILIYDEMGDPYLLAECKAYDVELDSAVLQQAIRYNKVMKAKFIVISNGLEHHCLQWNKESGLLKAIEAFPEYVKN